MARSGRPPVLPGTATCHWVGVLLLLALTAPTVEADEILLECQEGWKLIGYRCYRFFSSMVPWDSADGACRRYASELLTTKDFKSNEDVGRWVQGQGEYSGYWAGLRQEDIQDTDPNYLLKSNGRGGNTAQGQWGNGQPAVDTTTNQCVRIQDTTVLDMQEQTVHRKKWRLAPCEEKSPFVCQRPAAPRGSFHCYNGHFVRQALACDGEDDCGDASDEVNCDHLCAFHLKTQTSETMASPHYPHNYEDKMKCSWLIEVPLGFNVELKFTDFNTQVKQDEVIILFGNQLQLHEEKRLSGDLDTDGLTFISYNNFLTVLFSSDGNITAKGFSAEVLAVKAPIDEPYHYLTAIATPQALISPFYPNYLGSQDYTWIICAKHKRKIITLKIDDVDLKGKDRIIIRDGNSTYDHLLEEFMASSPIPSYILSTGQCLYITMQTRGVETGRGFNFTYHEGCSVQLTEVSGEIKSPGLDTVYYGTYQNCTYEVDVPGSPLSVQFITMKIHKSDRIMIYEGETLLHNISETSIPPPFVIDSGSFRVIFYSDSAHTDKGFRLIYSIDCEDPRSNDKTQLTPSTLSFKAGTNVTMSCRPGYAFYALEFLDLPEVPLRCLLGGKWNPHPLPFCEPKYCGPAPHVQNAQIVSGNVVTYLGEVTYRCYSGFGLTGSDTIRCTENGWTSAPTCRSASCPVLPDIDYGTKITLGDGYDTIVTYSCTSGYQIAGDPTLFCQGDGTWSNQTLPRCEALQCYVPPSHHIAMLDKGGQMIGVGEIVMVSCNQGYVSDAAGGVPYNVSCRENRTLLGLDDIICVYQNKCIADPSYCDHYCHDSEFGNLTCSCRDGYTLGLDLKSCLDIDECQTDNGGCDICTNTDGGYECSCEDGYVLFTSEGVQGYELAPSEDGMRPGDIRRFNHTCLPVRCEDPPDIANGRRRIEQKSFHYGDTVRYTCLLGFEMTGAAYLTCNQSGQWDNTFPQCENAKCLPGDSILSAQNPAKLTPSGPVLYGEIVTLTCDVPGKPIYNTSRHCVYYEGQYQLVGADYDCGFIDCGQPEGITGSDFTAPVNTKYGSQSDFQFACENLLRIEGSSRTGKDTTVRCTESGEWDFGSLRCAGMTCQDPGHPPNGRQVDVTSYDLGDLVSFACNEQGFMLSDPYPLKCQVTASGIGLEWNGTKPDCVDVEPPVLTGCKEEVTVPLFSKASDVLLFPNATDNVGVKNMYILNSIGSRIWLSEDFIISKEAHFTFIFVDFAGNNDSCATQVKLTDDIPPTVECPGEITKRFAVEDDLYYDLSSALPQHYDLNPAEVRFTIQDLLSTFPPYRVQEVTARVTDSFGRTAMCTFPLTFKAKDCSPFTLRKPVRGTKSCSPTGGNGFQCTLLCDEGYVFDHNTSESSLVYSCSDGGSWDAPDTPVCINVQQTFELSYNKDGNKTCSEQYRAAIEETIIEATSAGTVDGLCSLPDFSGYLNVTGIKEDHDSAMVYVNITLTYNMTDKKNLETCKQVARTYFEVGGNIVEDFKKTYSPGDCPPITPIPDFIGSFQEVPSGMLRKCTASNMFSWGGDLSGFYCVSCPEGTSKTDSGCELCPEGTFNNAHESDCEACSASTSTFRPGALSLSDCAEICAEGMYSPTGLPPCHMCPKNTFWVNNTFCEQCPGSSITRQTGATSVSECLPPCPEGTYDQIDGHGHNCKNCPRHFYTDEKGRTTCTECPQSHATFDEGSTSIDNCTVWGCTFENKCVNGGQCIMADHVASCDCPDGYSGRYCESETDPCSPNPCYYNGTCIRNGSEPICRCIAGTTGNFCEEMADSCTGSDYCKHGGACRNELNGKSCFCKTGFSGERCDMTTNICTSDLCQNGGECESLDNYRFYCHCSEGFEGPTCENSTNECASRPCLHGGKCSDQTNDFECSCPAGFSGKQCEIRLAQCETVDCGGGGTCVEDYDTQTYQCVCPEGNYYGTLYQYEASFGQQLQTSSALPVLFMNDVTVKDCMAQCEQNSCKGFLYSMNQQDCYVFNTTTPPLSSGNDVFYKRVGSKVEGMYWTPWYDSSNPDGTGDDEQKTTLDDIYGLNICKGNEALKAECRVVGSHKSPTEVLNINCTPSGGLLCNNNEQTDGQCEDYEIRFFCLSTGLVQPKCEKIAYCDSFCENAGTCTEEQTGGKCNCLPGYTGSRCQHLVDHCSNSPCQNGATCQNGLTGYTCDCPQGYTRADCGEYIDNCVPNPCSNGGSCQNHLNGYQCRCEAGFTGQKCEEEVDECQSNPCLHDGMCTDKVNGFTCDCKPGWTGSECEDMVKLCKADTCHGGATCVNLFNDFHCNCAPNSVGKTCSNVSSICSSANPCLHGSTCNDNAGVIKCECSEELMGDGCHIRRHMCSETDPQCQNGATCTISQGTFSCECPPGYTGMYCEENVDDCQMNSCPDGWTCTDMVNDYCCRCPQGNCENDIDRDFDLKFSHKSTMAALPCPVHLKGRGFTITMWLQYSKKQDEGTFFTMYKVNDPNSLSGKEELIRLDHDGATVSLNNQTVQIKPPPGVAYSENVQWHFIAVTWNEAGLLTLFVDTVRSTIQGYNPGMLLDMSVWIVLGGHYDPVSDMVFKNQGFHGTISHVTLYNRELEFDIELTQTGNAQPGHVFPDAVMAWGEFRLYPGVTRIYPSGVDEHCPPGLTEYPTCITPAPGKTMVNVDTNACPQDIILHSPNRVTKIDYPEVKFTGRAHDIKYSLQRGLLVLWGKYEVVVEASNDEGNKALCTFDIYIQHNRCESPSMPVNAEDVSCANFTDEEQREYRQCSANCQEDHLPVIPFPKLSTCGPIGSWDPPNLYLPYKFPPCGETSPPKRRLLVTIVYNVPSFECNTLESFLPAKVRSSLWDEVDQLNINGLCHQTGCADIELNFTCKQVQENTFGSYSEIKITADYVPDSFTIKNEEWSPEDLFRWWILDGQRFAFPDELAGAYPDLDESTVQSELLCQPPLALQGDLCVECDKGSYYDVNKTGCALCPIGQYQDQRNQSECKPCATNTITETEGSDKEEDCKWTCPLGQYFDNDKNDCTLCGQGFYQNSSGLFYCLPCPADKTTRVEGADSSALCFNDCPTGQELTVNGSCAACAIGFYKPSGHTLCLQCPHMLVTNYTGADSEDDCSVANNLPGYYRSPTNETERLPCPVGTYQPEKWQYICISCGGERYRTDSIASTSKADCKFFCPAGQQRVGNKEECMPCPIGSFRTGINPYSLCEPCPSDARTPTNGSISADNCTIKFCLPGSRINGSVCEPCPRGTYQDQPYQTECHSCPEGESTRETAVTSVGQCETYCDPGSEKNAQSGECDVCPIGYYKNNDDNVFMDCTLCRPGYVTPTTGSISNNNCTVRNCTAGYFIQLDNCQPCDYGQYQNLSYQTFCYPCEGDKNTTRMAAVSASECYLSCPVGKQNPSGTDDCEPCPQGSYKDHEGLENCAPCPSGNTTRSNGSTSSSDCNLRACEPGSYADSSRGGECRLCGLGEYQPDKWQEECLPCDSGLTTYQYGEDNVDRCLDICGAGKVFSNASMSCVPCPIGYYNNQSRVFTCILCPVDYITVSTGATSVSDCTIRNCTKPGQYRDTEDDSCKDCPIGEWQNQKWKTNCIQCETGLTTRHMGSPDKSDCKLDCISGKHLVNGSCEDCEVGYYRNKSESWFCQQCPRDLTTKGAGAVSEHECSEPTCTIGQYFNSLKRSCVRCEKHKYQNEPGKLHCKPCPVGFETEDEGATSLSECLDKCDIYKSSCDKHATCFRDGEKVECRCNYGYTGTGYNCTHICDTEDYCTQNSLRCDKNKFECVCKENYRGDRCETRIDTSKLTDKDIIVTTVVTVVCVALIIVMIIVFCVKRKSKRRKTSRHIFEPMNGSHMSTYSTLPRTMPHKTEYDFENATLQPKRRTEDPAYYNSAYEW